MQYLKIQINTAGDVTVTEITHAEWLLTRPQDVQAEAAKNNETIIITKCVELAVHTPEAVEVWEEMPEEGEYD
jgi:hypothetical protein